MQRARIAIGKTDAKEGYKVLGGKFSTTPRKKVEQWGEYGKVGTGMRSLKGKRVSARGGTLRAFRGQAKGTDSLTRSTRGPGDSKKASAECPLETSGGSAQRTFP